MADELITRQIKQMEAFADLPAGAEIPVQGNEGPAGRWPIGPLVDGYYLAFGIPAKADVGAAPIPPIVQRFRTLGCGEAGDGGGANYKRVSVEPAHPGKVQSFDGAWWEIDEPLVNVRQFGAAMDGVILTDAVMTVGSPTLTSASAPFTAADVGKPIFVNQAGSNTYGLWSTISGYVSASEVTLAHNAVASVSGATEDARCSFGTDDYQAYVDMLAYAEAKAVASEFGTTIRCFIPDGKSVFATLASGDVRGLRVPGNVCVENRGHLIMQAGNAIGGFLLFAPAVGQTNYGAAEFFGGIVDSNFQTNDNTAAFGNQNAGGTAPVGTAGKYCSLHDVTLCNARSGGSLVADPRVLSTIPSGGKALTIQFGAYAIDAYKIRVVNCHGALAIEGKSGADAGVGKSRVQLSAYNCRYYGLLATNNGAASPDDLNRANCELDLSFFDCANGVDAYGADVADNFGVLTGNAGTGMSGKVRIINTTGVTTVCRGSWWYQKLQVEADVYEARHCVDLDKHGGKGTTDGSSRVNEMRITLRVWSGVVTGYLLHATSGAFTYLNSEAHIRYSIYNPGGATWGGTSWAGAGGSGNALNVTPANANAVHIMNAAVGGHERSTPDDVAFRAYASAAVVNATGDGTAVNPVVLGTEEYDAASNFAANVFTAPYNGIYSFSWGLGLSGVDTAVHTRVLIQMQAGGVTYVLRQRGPTTETITGSKRHYDSGSIKIKLNAGQTAALLCNVNGSSKTVTIDAGQGSTWLEGHLIKRYPI